MIILDPITLLKPKIKIYYFDGWHDNLMSGEKQAVFDEGFIVDIYEDLNHVTVTPNNNLINHTDIVSYFMDDLEIEYPAYIERESE